MTRNEKGKFGNDYIVWENKKNGDRVSVWGITAGKINPKGYATKNNVRVIWEVKGKKYKSKSRALSVARAYMNKNNTC